MTKKISNPEILAVRAAAEADPARGRVWVGLDVGMKSTAVCVLDSEGKVVHQCAMKTHPTEIGRYLAKNFTSNVAVVGMETGAMSVHLSGGLRRLGYQVALTGDFALNAGAAMTPSYGCWSATLRYEPTPMRRATSSSRLRHDSRRMTPERLLHPGLINTEHKDVARKGEP